MPLAKLVRPALRGVVPRPRLFKLLDACRPVAWVWGPPGAGKTALAAGYVQSRRLRALWYQCDAGDADVGAFFAYLARAARRSLPRLTKEREVAPADFARDFFRALWDRTRPPAVLVLDGYEALPPEAALHDALGEAIGQLPPEGRVIVCSRAEPPAPLARLRANRVISTVGWSALRLTPGETRGVLRQLAPGSSAALAAVLHERSGGWAAGIVLMQQERRGLAAERRRVPDGIVDYFANEIMAKADRETQAILLETAFLPRFSGTMAEALTGRAHAGRVLARLHRDGGFVLQHAEPPVAYEYHPLVRAFLLRRAYAVLTTAGRAAIQRRAAALLERDGHVTE
ncbi:MAG TPA: hypothetical protein VFL90_13725, partial [Methylomirabilota bacterium]|nr:hypothetical protein [Methylomirabilota bacterium]